MGLACIALVYALGAMTGKPLSGSLAALLLAASGYHVFWSQVARMFAQACFLGLASTVLLLWLARGARHRLILGTCYGGPDPGGCRDTRLFLDVVRYSHDLGSCPRVGRG